MNAICTVGGRGMSDVAERQMRTWALKLQTQQQLVEERVAAPIPKLVCPYLVVSREAGVDARELAQAVASKCGWKLLDRELLDYMAEHDHLSRLTLDFVDERAANWFHEMFGQWLDKQLISQAEYVSRLGKLVLLAAQHESTVFVGRGAQFLLPREAGLAVRVIGPRKQRVDRLMRSRNCSAREAERFMDETDYARAQFVRRYFHRDVADPHLYDLVLNLAHLSREEVVDLIVRECKRHS
jgi:Cytidylate kinase-like family